MAVYSVRYLSLRIPYLHLLLRATSGSCDQGNILPFVLGVYMAVVGSTMFIVSSNFLLLYISRSRSLARIFKLETVLPPPPYL